ncbi:Protein sidekick-2 [Branchiostoma belcheri]|nr:Protein sidekick-2 [Branchiostoma belcheri]
MGEENIMGAKLPGKLLSLLIILKVFGSTEASCSLADSYADCRSQGLASVPQNLPTGITNLDLRYNQITTIINIDNNPWQCDCRLVPFRQKMNGSHSFENQITCEGPSNFWGQKLIDISPEDLICEEPTIARFKEVHNYTVVEGGSLYLVCEASGIPTPDITVILPSGLNATLESSGGRVTVGVNGAITIPNVTAEDAGLYACVAVSPVGSTIAILVVNVQLKATTTNQTPPVVFSNTSAMVTISEHDQTGNGGVQTRSSEHVPGRATSEVLEYEDVVLPPRNVNTSLTAAGLIQQPHEYQSLEPNRNRAPSDELPSLPPPSNRNNGGTTGAHYTPHYYQSLKKKAY